MFCSGAKAVVDAESGRGGGHELHEAASSGAGDGEGVAVAFGLDDGGEQIGVDVVEGAGAGEHLVHLGGGERGGGCVGGPGGSKRRGGCGRRRVGDGLDAKDGAGGDFDVVGVVGRGLADGARGGEEVEADAVAGRLLTDAVELSAVAEGDVFGGVGRRTHGRDGCKQCWSESGAEGEAPCHGLQTLSYDGGVPAG